MINAVNCNKLFIVAENFESKISDDDSKESIETKTYMTRGTYRKEGCTRLITTKFVAMTAVHLFKPVTTVT